MLNVEESHDASYSWVEAFCVDGEDDGMVNNRKGLVVFDMLVEAACK